MSERKILERFDANLLNVPIHDLYTLNKKDFNNRLQHLHTKTNGKLFVKEYPTSCASIADFEILIDEIEAKYGIKFDAVFVDYLNIAISSRIKMGSTNSYGWIKAIAEELRGLFVRKNVAGWTATQTQRGAAKASDFGENEIAESFAIAHVVDLMLGLIVDEQMKEDNEAIIKQIYNRYAGTSTWERMRMKFNRDYMMLEDHPDTLSKMEPYFQKYDKIEETKEIEYVDPETGEIMKIHNEDEDDAWHSSNLARIKPKSNFSNLSFD